MSSMVSLSSRVNPCIILYISKVYILFLKTDKNRPTSAYQLTLSGLTPVPLETLWCSIQTGSFAFVSTDLCFPGCVLFLKWLPLYLSPLLSNYFKRKKQFYFFDFSSFLLTFLSFSFFLTPCSLPPPSHLPSFLYFPYLSPLSLSFFYSPLANIGIYFPTY